MIEGSVEVLLVGAEMKRQTHQILIKKKNVDVEIEPRTSRWNVSLTTTPLCAPCGYHTVAVIYSTRYSVGEEKNRGGPPYALYPP